MADGSQRSARSQIGGIVQGLLAKRSVSGPIGPSQPLADLGLTSLDMVNLMLAVEEEFGVELPQNEMTPDNFRTIAAIESLVTRLAV